MPPSLRPALKPAPRRRLPMPQLPGSARLPGRLALWSPRLPLVLLLRGLLHGASAVDAVKKGKGTACIMASFSAAFSMNYDSKMALSTWPLTCHQMQTAALAVKRTIPPSRLVMGFGGGQTLTFHFPRNATRDGVQLTSFVHSLSDTHIFPSASSEEMKMAESLPGIKAPRSA